MIRGTTGSRGQINKMSQEEQKQRNAPRFKKAMLQENRIKDGETEVCRGQRNKNSSKAIHGGHSAVLV